MLLQNHTVLVVTKKVFAMPHCCDKKAIEGWDWGQSVNRNVWAWMSPADWWGILKVCGIKECQGCCQEFSIDKDVCVCACVWLWWSEVSRPPPRACNSGFSSITPSPSPLVLSHPLPATYLNQLAVFLLVSLLSMPSNTPYKLLHASVCPPSSSSSFYHSFFFSLFISPSLSLPLHLSSPPYTLAPGEYGCGGIVSSVHCQGVPLQPWFMSAFTAGMFA